jgi:hypothetical protein
LALAPLLPSAWEGPPWGKDFEDYYA